MNVDDLPTTGTVSYRKSESDWGTALATLIHLVSILALLTSAPLVILAWRAVL